MHMAADRWPAKDGPTLCGWWGEWGCSKVLGAATGSWVRWGGTQFWDGTPNWMKSRSVNARKLRLAFCYVHILHTWAVTLHWQAKELQWLASLQPGRALARWSPWSELIVLCMIGGSQNISKYHEKNPSSKPKTFSKFPDVVAAVAPVPRWWGGEHVDLLACTGRRLLPTFGVGVPGVTAVAKTSAASFVAWSR